MSSKQKNPYADTEFIRAHNIEVRECQSAYAVGITQCITPACRPDRIEILLKAYEAGSVGVERRLLCLYKADWPDAEGRSFSAALFRAAVQLTRLVQDSRSDLLKEWAAEGKKG